MTSTRTSRSRKFGGFTLLEVLLSLGLMVIIVAAIGTAINLHLTRLATQQNSIENKQISRSVIAMFQNDIRSGVQTKPEDYTGLENLSASLDLIAGIADNVGLEGDLGDAALGAEEPVDPNSPSADALAQLDGATAAPGQPPGSADLNAAVGSGIDTTGDAPTGTGTGTTGSTGDAAGSQEGEEGEEDEEEEEEVARPAFVGAQNFVRIDISRLPRMDQYNLIIAQLNELENTPSDIKTITYFFSNQASNDETDVENDIGSQGGLYRREVDRAIAAFAEDDGLSTTPDENSVLVAPEVVGVEFRFWDGEEWVTEWDSEEMGGFPRAIEVQLLIDPDIEQTRRSGNPIEREEMELHRTVIDLPIAEIIAEDEEEDSQ